MISPEVPATPPLFARIGVVGLGLMGGSVALAARRAWPSALVIGVDRNEVLEAAQRAHAIDVGADDVGMLAEVNLVVLAAPVSQNILTLRELPDVMPGEAVLSDLGSAKRTIVDAARALPARLTFVGGHPLAGAARAGIEHASPELFSGRPWILTPADSRGDGSPAVAKVLEFVRALGAVPHVMSADDHDQLVSWVSHLPQLAASALMRVIGDAVGEKGLMFAGRGLRDTTRLASSPAHVWTDICEANADLIARALDTLIDELKSLRDGLDDSEAIARVFEEAALWRERLR